MFNVLEASCLLLRMFTCLDGGVSHNFLLGMLTRCLPPITMLMVVVWRGLESDNVKRTSSTIVLKYCAPRATSKKELLIAMS